VSALTTIIGSFLGEAVKTQTSKVPLLFRVYSGQTCVFKHRELVKCTVTRTELRFAVTPVHIRHKSFDGSWTISKMSMSLDYPLLDQFETWVPDWEPIMCPKNGNVVLDPREGQLLSLTTPGWGY